jgi:hypothetical protein
VGFFLHTLLRREGRILAPRGAQGSQPTWNHPGKIPSATVEVGLLLQLSTPLIFDKIYLCWRSSVVEQRFCKPSVVSSILTASSRPGWRSRQTHRSVKPAPQGYGGANPSPGTDLNMNQALSRLLSLFLLAVFLNSPFFLVPYFPQAQTPLISPLATETTITNVTKFHFTRPQKSQFAALIKKSLFSPILAAQTKKEIVEKSEIQAEKQPTGPSSTFIIAVLGDSMIDVMQPDLPQLKSALQKYFPQAQFKFLNYGVGASNIEYALQRLTSDYTYLDRDFPSLLSQNPDIVVVESFAYNHWDNDQVGLDRQWLALAKIIETIKAKSEARIVLASTIGPDETALCDGIDGFNLPPDQKREKAQTIRTYLQNLINFATSQGYPLADAYHPSLENNGNGKAVYINANDHLHPSGPGGELLAQKIAEAVYKFSLL